MTNETKIKNKVKVTITIDSIDFVDNQEKQVHVKDAVKLKEYIDSNEIYFDFFNKEVYRYFEEVDDYLRCGTINEGNQIALTFELEDVYHQLKRAIDLNQEIFYDFFNHEAWIFNEDGNEESLGGFSYFQLIDVAQIEQD
jgi:hypothetical protein